MNHARITFVLLLIGLSKWLPSYSQTQVMTKGEFAHNPALKYHPLKESYQGTPISKGRYYNPDYPFLLTFKDVQKWKKQTNPNLEFKKTDTFQLPFLKSWIGLKTIRLMGLRG